MKALFLFLILLISTKSFCQTNPFSPKIETDFSFSQPDTLKVVSLNQLGKMSLSNLQIGNELPSDYHWTKDLRRMESVKRMTLEPQIQNTDGRELPPDAFQTVRNNAIWRSTTSD